MMLILIYLFIAGGIGLIVGYFFKQKTDVAVNPRFAKEIKERKRRQTFTASFEPLRILRPLNRPLLKLLGGEYNLTQKLLAGRMKLGPEDFLLVKEILAIGIPAGLYFIIGPKLIQPVWFVAAAAFGFLLPDFHLKARINKRKSEIVRCLPDTIDLLALCVSGGLDFMTGLKWVIERSRPSALVEEFSIVFHELGMGRSRQDSFRDMAKRLDLPEIFSFVRTIIQADKMGVSVGEVLSILSDEVRRQRFQRGERMALKAPIKMLLPLIVFILPVIGIIVGAPVILQFMQQGGLKGGVAGTSTRR